MSTPSPSHRNEAHARRAADPVHDDDEVRDADGLLIDEYSDAAIVHVRGSDALDHPVALTTDAVLDDVADASDGITEIDFVEEDVQAESLGQGRRRVGVDRETEDEALEPHSVDDLARLSIGNVTPGAADQQDPGQMHGERFLDAPDNEAADGEQ